MRLALTEARKAASMNEVPIGAIVVAPDGSIIGRGHNLTESLHDVTAHAEMQAITAPWAANISTIARFTSLWNLALCVPAR